MSSDRSKIAFDTDSILAIIDSGASLTSTPNKSDFFKAQTENSKALQFQEYHQS